MASENGKLIFKLIPQVMKAIGPISKGRFNEQQKYAFRGIDEIYNAIQPVLSEHGVFVLPSVIDQKREERKTRHDSLLMYTILTVKHTFCAPDGSYVEAVTVGEAMDTGDKSANKAMSAAMKYALLEVFCIPTEGDNDPDSQSHQVKGQQPAKGRGTLATADQVREIKGLLNVVRLPEGLVDKWLAKAKADRWEDMPAAAMKNCIKYLKDRLPANVAAE